jgi:hypothetical protein
MTKWRDDDVIRWKLYAYWWMLPSLRGRKETRDSAMAQHAEKTEAFEF